MQPVNPAANAAANAPANAPANTAGNSENNHPMLSIFRETPPRTQDTIQELNLLQPMPIGQKGANVTA
jgi:hypothetical protein